VFVQNSFHFCWIISLVYRSLILVYKFIFI